MSDSWSRGHGFDSRTEHHQAATLGKLLTPCASVTKQYNLVPAKGWWCSAIGKASHWPCITDFNGLSTYGLNVHGNGDDHPTYAPYWGMSTLPFTSRIYLALLLHMLTVVYHACWPLHSLHLTPPHSHCRHLLAPTTAQTLRWLSCGQRQLVADSYWYWAS